MNRHRRDCGRRAWRRLLAALLTPALVAGCARYTPKPLPESVAWSHDAGSLRVDPSRIALPRLAAQRIDTGAPLSMQAVAALAVLNDPRLLAARDRLGVARAQAFDAGLLPDPQFSASRDIPLGRDGASTTAYNLGLGFDLGWLMTRGAAEAAARANLRRVDLQLLWQEWQTAASAELSYVKLAGLIARDRIRRRQLQLVTARRSRDLAALAAGDAPRTTADADLVEAQALQQSLADDSVAALAQRAALNAMLGLAPDVVLPLAPLPADGGADVAQARAALAHLSDIRPDLMALRAGYESQEQTLRGAVLSQFPSISVGFTRARDTSNINTAGLGVSFNLPILNGSRGRIAVARATRRELADRDRVRLAQARAGAEQAIANIQLLRGRALALAQGIPTLTDAALAADAALADGDITLPQAQAQRMALLDARLARQANIEQIAEQAVALQLLTGRGVFAAAAPTSAH